MQAQTISGLKAVPLRMSTLCFIGMMMLRPLFGATASLRPSADTSLFSSFADNNLGASSNLVSGANGSSLPNRALLRFDLAKQIPTNAIIQSASLTLQVVIIPGSGGADSVFDLRRVLTPWSEGAGPGNTGSPANVGETTYANRSHPFAAWTVPGGSISNDFSEISSASTLIKGIGSYTFTSTDALLADVRQWVSNPMANFGWALLSESESIPFTARRFGSREDPTRSPLLTVEYLLPDPALIKSINAGLRQVELTFTLPSGQPCAVQFRDSLSAGNWLTLTNVAARDGITDLTIHDPSPANVQRFYRLGLF